MTASFTLTLDTTAPVVTWGAVGGGGAGQLLQVAYTVDESALQSATLVLADGRRLAMDVYADRVAVVVPPDVQNQWATVSAVATDGVGNTRTATLRVELTGGGTGPPPPPPAGPQPFHSTEPIPSARRLERRSHARASSTGRIISSSRRGATRAGSVSTYALRSARTGAAAHSTSSSAQIRVALKATSSARTLRVDPIIRRREGPDEELALLTALDLL